MAAPKFFIDTDNGGDVDDIGALAIAGTLHRLGLIELLGVNVCITGTQIPSITAAVLQVVGAGSVPVGVTKQANAFDPDGGDSGVIAWRNYLYSNYGSVKPASQFPDRLDVFRQAIISQPDSSVSVIQIGMLNNAAAYLAAYPDLIAKKVKAQFIMGGYYPSTGASEFNLANAAVDAQTVMSSWPTPLIFTSYQNGITFIIGDTVNTAFPADDMVRWAYDNYVGGAGGRYCWDSLAIMMAFHTNGGFGYVKGTNSMSGSANVFVPGTNGPHAYMVKTDPDQRLKDRMNFLLTLARATNSTTWPSTAGLVRLQ